VVIHHKKDVDPCYRLISSRNLQAAHLILPSGRYIHSWHYPGSDQVTSDFGGFGMTWHYAEMLPNGHLVAIIKDEMIIELDWNSQLVWKQKVRAHHDFARLDNGHTLVVSRRDIDNPWQPGATIAMDELVQYSPAGDIVWTWQYEDHLQEIERLAEQPLPPHARFKDWPHINTCEVLRHSPLAQKDSRFKAGNLLLCGRHANTIFVVDKQSAKVVWAWGSDHLQGPHMPTLLDNGHILVYDNGQHTPDNARKYTRVLEIDPTSRRIVWQYSGKPRSGFYSPSRGSNNRLKNGNTLIAESDSGHLIEVDTDGRIVWEYWNSDYTRSQRRMALYRVVPYERSVVDPLLDRFGRIKDVIPQHQENLKLPKIGPNVQYKKLIREVVFYTELGYYDLALQLLDSFQKVFPNDPEADYGYCLVYSAKKDARRSFASMLTALDKGMALERFTCGLGPLLDCLLNSPVFLDYIRERPVQLVHGPVLGAVTDRSMRCWIRTFAPSSVQVLARKKGQADFSLRSQNVTTSVQSESTAVVNLDHLQPATTYEYKVVIDNDFDTGLSEFSTAPVQGRPAKFSTGFGGGAGYTPKYLYVWDTIRSHALPFFLLLGDNVYIDHPERPYTQQYCYQRIQSRPEYRRFTANTAMYAIWDDHDFTFNDGKGSTEIETPAWKRRVWDLFRKQWNNPYYGGGQDHPGCWFDFSHGDVDFFMLDCRYYREPPRNNPRASMLGAYQKQWLFDRLKNSQACFKVLGSSVPWAQGTKPGSLDTWDGHPQEREEIFQFITDNKIEGVILISADRHRSDAWRIDRPKGYRLYEFESSKLSNMHTHKVMPGSLFGYNKTCSFGLLDFDTTAKDPSVTYRIMTIDNQEIHRLTVYKSDLSFKSR